MDSDRLHLPDGRGVVIIIDKSFVGPWVAEKCGTMWIPDGCETIGWITGDGLTAGVWYKDYNGASIVAAIAISGPISRRFLWAIFDYPFNQLRVNKLICSIEDTNRKSLSLVKKMGFVEEARLTNAHPEGDLVLVTMTKEQCKYLKGKYHAKVE